MIILEYIKEILVIISILFNIICFTNYLRYLVLISIHCNVIISNKIPIGVVQTLIILKILFVVINAND